MMRNLGKWRAAALALIGISGAAVLSPAGAASAQIEQAKANCVVGERNDGYLGVVAGRTVPRSLKRELDDINLQRKAAYAELAAEQGVSVQDTAVLAAEALIARATTGQCVQNAQGDWIRIP